MNTMYVTSIEIKAYKFIANFNRPQAADKFIEFLNTKLANDNQFIGYKQRVKNSVIYVCHDKNSGHALAKEFEDGIIANEMSKINEAMKVEEQPIHPIVENQVMVEDTQAEQHTSENTVDLEPDVKNDEDPSKEKPVNKIMSMFKNNNQ